jgi:hypothetical protein
MPRHKRHDRPVQKKINFRESLVSQVDASLRDPLTGQPRFASWSELLHELLDGWLDGRFKVSIEPFRMNLEELADETENNQTGT